MLNNEIWKDIEDLPYQVSNLGNVRRHPESKYKHKGNNYIQPYINKTGYQCVNLYKHSKVHKFLVHRLVAIYFISNPEDKPYINHKDGDRLNNSLDNLEWCTQSENCQHAWDTGLQTNRYANASVKRKNSSSRYVGVSWSEQRQRWCTCIGINKKTIGLGRHKSEIEAAKAYDNYVIENDLRKLGYATNFI